LNSSIVNGARVVGPSIAGLMIGAVGVTTCFFLNGVTFVAVIAGLLMMRLPPFERPAHVVSPGEHAWNGIVYSMKHQRVRTILLLFFAVGVFGWSYAVLMPAFARDVLGRGANGYGLLMSASDPPQIENNIIGADPTAATTPSSNLEFVISYTNQLIAVCCIHVPMSETSWPQKKRR
ncbi:MAG: MFS transporter, partial [Verrucomicrobia bacterium]